MYHCAHVLQTCITVLMCSFYSCWGPELMSSHLHNVHSLTKPPLQPQISESLANLRNGVLELTVHPKNSTLGGSFKTDERAG